MPRLRQVPRDAVTDPAIKGQYERIFSGRDPVKEPGTKDGTPGTWWTTGALVPDIHAHQVRNYNIYANPKNAIDPVYRELGQTRAGWLAGSQFVFSQHCKACRAVGLSDEQVAAIPGWKSADCFDDRQRAVLAYTDYLVSERGRVPDAVFEKLKGFLSEEAIFELTYIVTMYEMQSVIARALRLEFDDRDDLVVEIPVPR
jgi:alkylhydroperoxidase family enzyme